MKDSGAEILRSLYETRSTRRNYSLRAFAREIGLSHTYVSLVLSGKKRLPLKTLRNSVLSLGIDPTLVPAPEPTATPAAAATFQRLALDRFRLLRRWYYVALMELMEIPSFPFSEKNAASYFALPVNEVREAVHLLKRLDLVKFENGRWSKVNARVSVFTQGSLDADAIREYHRQMISKAIGELYKTDEASFRQRNITGITMPVNPRRIAGAKKRIAKFRRSLEAYLTQGECSEVYQLNVQLFTLRGAGENEITRGVAL